jgi:uncharacterized SAM-binding protein YcdF (DUF218 family)
LENDESKVAQNSGSGHTGLLLVLALVAAYAIGFVLFVANVPMSMDRIRHADGVVALTGGDVRILAADNLFEANVGKRLLISGVHPGITKSDIKKLVHGGARFECCVDLGFEATNTRGNAIEAANWAREHDFRSLVVVTANYHMPRSLLEFRDVMPDMKLFPYPVQQEDVDLRNWWSDSHAFRELQGEYVKYLGSLVVTSLFPTSRVYGHARADS